MVGVPVVSARVSDLLARMSPEEKVGQLVGAWLGQGGEAVAPMAGAMVNPASLEEASEHGLGHLTRVYGTWPVEPAERAAWLWQAQRQLRTGTRLGIPAIVHEECLTGFAAWQAAGAPFFERNGVT
ncbi:MAG TPA: glycosyl hydrolase, partial [Verrucomicrobiota bacterium]|nr:glycosyl hydrolase [Verrucomicrobiota bacterium]